MQHCCMPRCVFILCVCVCLQMQTLIKQEVRSEAKRNENKLQDLIESVQNLDQAVDYEKTIQKLEVGGSSGASFFTSLFR